MNYVLLSLFLFYIGAFGKDITFSSCYKGYYFFIPVIKNCISYVEKEGEGRFTATVETIGILKAFKDIKYRGFALSINDKSKKFFFVQREKDFSVEYWYEFKDALILTKKSIKRGSVIRRFSKVVPNEEGYLDPFTATVLLFKTFRYEKEGFLSIFFDGEKYKIPYKFSKREEIRVGSKSYRCYVLVLEPRLQGEGLIKTKGKWKIWVDERTGFPVKIRAVFDKGVIVLNKI
ncbi:MAG: DUF3108 domain-containing protein [Aquificae bacterium]|nr:DUF3108 domain-containing protein [Aquificota bacterium]